MNKRQSKKLQDAFIKLMNGVDALKCEFVNEVAQIGCRIEDRTWKMMDYEGNDREIAEDTKIALEIRKLSLIVSKNRRASVMLDGSAWAIIKEMYRYVAMQETRKGM